MIALSATAVAPVFATRRPSSIWLTAAPSWKDWYRTTSMQPGQIEDGSFLASLIAPPAPPLPALPELPAAPACPEAPDASADASETRPPAPPCPALPPVLAPL